MYFNLYLIFHLRNSLSWYFGADPLSGSEYMMAQLSLLIQQFTYTEPTIQHNSSPPDLNELMCFKVYLVLSPNQPSHQNLTLPGIMI